MSAEMELELTSAISLGELRGKKGNENSDDGDRVEELWQCFYRRWGEEHHRAGDAFSASFALKSRGVGNELDRVGLHSAGLATFDRRRVMAGR